RNLRQLPRPAAAFQHQDIALDDEYAVFAQQMNRLGRVADDHPYDGVIDGVDHRDRVNVDRFVRERLTDGGERPGFVFEEEGELLLNFHRSASGGLGLKPLWHGWRNRQREKSLAEIVRKTKFIVAFGSIVG